MLIISSTHRPPNRHTHSPDRYDSKPISHLITKMAIKIVMQVPSINQLLANKIPISNRQQIWHRLINLSRNNKLRKIRLSRKRMTILAMKIKPKRRKISILSFQYGGISTTLSNRCRNYDLFLKQVLNKRNFSTRRGSKSAPRTNLTALRPIRHK